MIFHRHRYFQLETTYNGRKNPVEFDGQCRTVAISNLNSTEDNLVVRVEAIPKNQDFTPEKFKEQVCYDCLKEIQFLFSHVLDNFYTIRRLSIELIDFYTTQQLSMEIIGNL